MVQTPQQRRANLAFAKTQEKKMGRATSDLPTKKEKPQKSPISPIWLYLLIFVIVGGLAFEAIRMIVGLF
ncbi:related to secretory pathway protein YSY6 [Ramularia collo-cygni]|uniref:Stress-associated endoplasmic reticulum protein n=1 Tax=Ramularia collo-cygni TaxID=112498 RepID=A0A2D3UQI3_9PEZI|nr:related to secretory pathway protein YSY6 [Ramularia collo-cygni]CZT18011.1 related to secretory pathway protein YSY6 [Ramularia collo-cygni]